MPVQAEFLARYDAMLERFPAPVESLDVAGRHGTTRVNVCGDPGAPPVVLLPGGGATSTVWWAVAGALAGSRRVFAVDPIGDRGRGVYDGEPVRRVADLMRWLDETLDAVGVPEAAVVAHSYGGWVATRYALHAPHRVNRLALLDPTSVLCRNRPLFQLRAVPLVLRCGRDAYASFVRWEAGGRDLDPGWFALWSTPFGGRTTLVWPRRLPPGALRTLAPPVLLVLAGRSRQNSATAMAAAARRWLPRARVVTLPGATHFTLPQDHEVGAALRDFHR
jgi:pimeloyl-ACP methyl ester carboxylesterase